MRKSRIVFSRIDTVTAKGLGLGRLRHCRVVRANLVSQDFANFALVILANRGKSPHQHVLTTSSWEPYPLCSNNNNRNNKKRQRIYAILNGGFGGNTDERAAFTNA